MSANPKLRRLPPENPSVWPAHLSSAGAALQNSQDAAMVDFRVSDTMDYIVQQQQQQQSKKFHNHHRQQNNQLGLKEFAVLPQPSRSHTLPQVGQVISASDEYSKI
jgi:hypothetical protein